MNNSRTIVQAIEEVLLSARRPMTSDHIFHEIVERGLFTFKAATPKAIVRQQLRRHTLGIAMRSAPEEKRFAMTRDGLYQLIALPK